MRNTLRNKASKQNVNPLNQITLPALSPDQTANYYQQLSGMTQQHMLDLAQLRQQRVGLRADARNQEVAIHAQGVQDVTAAQQGAAQAGIQGSSIEYNNMSAATANMYQQRQAVKDKLLSDLAANQLQRQQSALTLYNSQTALASQSLAQQQQLLASQLQNNNIVSGRESNFNALNAFYRQYGGGNGR
jgi:hypothetical protein